MFVHLLALGLGCSGALLRNLTAFLGPLAGTFHLKILVKVIRITADDPQSRGNGAHDGLAM
jgi:hypothetical protein